MLTTHTSAVSSTSAETRFPDGGSCVGCLVVSGGFAASLLDISHLLLATPSMYPAPTPARRLAAAYGHEKLLEPELEEDIWTSYLNEAHHPTATPTHSPTQPLPCEVRCS